MSIRQGYSPTPYPAAQTSRPFGRLWTLEYCSGSPAAAQPCSTQTSGLAAWHSSIEFRKSIFFSPTRTGKAKFFFNPGLSSQQVFGGYQSIPAVQAVVSSPISLTRSPKLAGGSQTMIRISAALYRRLQKNLFKENPQPDQDQGRLTESISVPDFVIRPPTIQHTYQYFKA